MFPLKRLCWLVLQPTGAPRGRRNAPPRSRQPYNGGGAGRGTANGSTTAAARAPEVSALHRFLANFSRWAAVFLVQY